MVFTLDHVKTLLESNLVSELRNVQSVISKRLEKGPLLTQSNIYELLTVTKTGYRKIPFERDIPDIIENVVALMK